MFQPPVSPPTAFQPPVSHPTPPEDAAAPEGSPVPDVLTPEARLALADLLREGRVVAHRPCFARLFGGAACGVLLSQFWFWSGTPTVQDRTGGWFWKSQREITEETGLSRAETETARRRLRALGVLEEERRGIPSTLHFRLDMTEVLRRLWAHLQTVPGPLSGPPGAASPQTVSRVSRTLVRGVPASRHAGIAQTTSETTSEKTQEKTQTRARPFPPAAFGREAVRKEAITKKEVVLSGSQCAVNRSGAARLKAALDAAPRRAPPLSLTPGGRSDILGRAARKVGAMDRAPTAFQPALQDGRPTFQDGRPRGPDDHPTQDHPTQT